MKVAASTLTALAVLVGIAVPASAAKVQQPSAKLSKASNYSNDGEAGTVIGPRVRLLAGAKVTINPQPLPPGASGGLR